VPPVHRSRLFADFTVFHFARSTTVARPPSDAVSKAFAAIAKTVGIKAKGVSLHSQRHFVASQSITDGSDVRTVAALLGHSDPSTTSRI
jgi:site-specific recombinase XerD